MVAAVQTVAGRQRQKCFADWCLAVRRGEAGYLRERYNSVVKAAMGEVSGTIGGYTVPVEYSARLFRVVSEESFFRPRATIIPMESATVTVPVVDATSTATAGSSPFFGGMVFNWGTAEGAAITETEPKTRALSLRANDLVGVAYASNQLLQDANEIADDYLLELFGKALAWYEDLAFFAGNGVGRPQGVINAPCAIAVTRQTASQFTILDAGKMVAKLIPYSWKNACWVIHPTVAQYLVQFSGWQVNEPRHEGAFTHLHSLPVWVSEKVSALGTKGDVVLFDPTLYAVGSREEIGIAVSDKVLFTTNQSAFRIWARSDGKPMLDAPVTLQDGTSTASSVVVLN